MFKYFLKLAIKIAFCCIFFLLIYPIFADQNLIIHASSTVRFLYDGDGVRVAKIEEGKTTVYVGDMERNIQTGETTKYYGLGGKRIAVKDNSGTNYIVSEHLGSLITLTDSTGKPKADIRYYPYGTVRAKTGTAIATRQYTGQINDDSTGLYFYNARYYDPQNGSFISADTIQSTNRYAYVKGNPLRLIDPTGHDAGLPPEEESLDSYKDPVFRKILEGYLYYYYYMATTGQEVTPESSLSFLSSYIFNNVSYSGAISEELDMMNRSLDRIDSLKQQLAGVEDMDKRDEITKEIQLNYFIYAYSKNYVLDLRDKAMQMNLSDRYKNDLMTCTDFSLLYAEMVHELLGVPTMVAGVYSSNKDLQHAVVLAKINNGIMYIDPTYGEKTQALGIVAYNDRSLTFESYKSYGLTDQEVQDHLAWFFK